MSIVEQILTAAPYDIDLIFNVKKDGIFVAVLAGNNGELVEECAGWDIKDALDTLEQSLETKRLWEYLQDGDPVEDWE